MKAVAVDAAERYSTPADLGAALGARTRLLRTWKRDIPCPGHSTCFTGTRPGAATFKVCAVPTGGRGRNTVEARRLPAGTRILTPPWLEITAARLSKELRNRMRDLT